MKKSNIGQKDTESIRLKGMTIDELPIAESAKAKEQLPIVEKNFKKQQIEQIKKDYPKQSISYLEGCVRECEGNIKRIGEIRDKEQGLISEYTSTIALCAHRDKELSKFDANNSDDLQKIKDLKKQFPPYDVKAMQQQIEQSTESINRCVEVIAKEYETKADLMYLIDKCKERDIKFGKLI